MGVSKNSGTPKVFHYFHHPFGGTPILGNTHINEIPLSVDSKLFFSTSHNSSVGSNPPVELPPHRNPVVKTGFPRRPNSPEIDLPMPRFATSPGRNHTIPYC